jgi:hypothetical protein
MMSALGTTIDDEANPAKNDVVLVGAEGVELTPLDRTRGGLGRELMYSRGER